MRVYITYFVHGTTIDNEKGISSGWSDTELSELGIKQATELKEKVKGKKFDVVFCSDLKRAVESAKLTWGNAVRIVRDERLRECNYGNLSGSDSKKVDKLMKKYVNEPFPNGESYRDVEKRIRSFLKDLGKNYSGKHIAIVAHRAPQLALDVIIKGKSWQQAMKEDWRLKKAWQPGWEYILESQDF
jgi:alpha-ribazole phosphatase/probable phosphoglycerate mutase